MGASPQLARRRARSSDDFLMFASENLAKEDPRLNVSSTTARR
jgi:hypothetical protein